MSAAVIMMAKTGRLTLTSASFIGLLPPRRPRPPCAAAASACAAGVVLAAPPVAPPTPVASWFRLRRRQRLVALQPVDDFDELVLPRAERHDLLLARLAVLDDVDRRDAGQRRDGVVGHRQHVRRRRCVSDDALGEEAGLELAVGVVDERFDGERARRLIDRRADVGDLAVERLVRERLDAELDRLARPG